MRESFTAILALSKAVKMTTRTEERCKGASVGMSCGKLVLLMIGRPIFKSWLSCMLKSALNDSIPIPSSGVITSRCS